MLRQIGKLVVYLILVLAGIAVGYMMFSGTKWKEYQQNALSLTRDGQYEEAVAEWLKAKSEADKDPSPEGQAARLRGQKELAILHDLYRHDYPLAIKEYKLIVERFPHAPEALWAAERLARIFAFKTPNMTEAETWYRWLIDHAPTGKEQNRFRYTLAKLFVDVGDFEPARELLGHILAAEPNEEQGADSLFLLGESFLLEKQYAEALERLQLLRERYPESEQSQLAGLDVGTCLYELGRYEEAVRVLKEILSSYPNPAVVQTKLDKIHKKLEFLQSRDPSQAAKSTFWMKHRPKSENSSGNSNPNTTPQRTGN